MKQGDKKFIINLGLVIPVTVDKYRDGIVVVKRSRFFGRYKLIHRVPRLVFNNKKDALDYIECSI